MSFVECPHADYSLAWSCPVPDSRYSRSSGERIHGSNWQRIGVKAIRIISRIVAIRCVNTARNGTWIEMSCSGIYGASIISVIFAMRMVPINSMREKCNYQAMENGAWYNRRRWCNLLFFFSKTEIMNHWKIILPRSISCAKKATAGKTFFRLRSVPKSIWKVFAVVPTDKHSSHG